jgi:hypothetical protein
LFDWLVWHSQILVHELLPAAGNFMSCKHRLIRHCAGWFRVGEWDLVMFVDELQCSAGNTSILHKHLTQGECEGKLLTLLAWQVLR